MKLSMDTQDVRLNHKVQKHESCLEDPLRWTQDVDSYHFPPEEQYVLVSYHLLFISACCTFVIQSSKKGAIGQ